MSDSEPQGSAHGGFQSYRSDGDNFGRRSNGRSEGPVLFSRPVQSSFSHSEGSYGSPASFNPHSAPNSSAFTAPSSSYTAPNTSLFAVPKSEAKMGAPNSTNAPSPPPDLLDL